MLTYQIKRNCFDITIEVKGHANYSSGGTDIVCSACSILWYTLLEQLSKCCIFDLVEEADANKIVIIDKYYNSVHYAIDFFETGMNMLANDYSNHVQRID